MRGGRRKHKTHMFGCCVPIHGVVVEHILYDVYTTAFYKYNTTYMIPGNQTERYLVLLRAKEVINSCLFICTAILGMPANPTPSILPSVYYLASSLPHRQARQVRLADKRASYLPPSCASVDERQELVAEHEPVGERMLHISIRCYCCCTGFSAAWRFLIGSGIRSEIGFQFARGRPTKLLHPPRDCNHQHRNFAPEWPQQKRKKLEN